MRIAILDDYQHVALRMADWSGLADCEIAVADRHLQGTALTGFLAGAEVVVAMRERTPFDAATLAAFPDLRLLVTTGMRNASIDMAAARAQGVLVCGTPGGGHGTAELAFGMLIALMRHLPQEVAGLRAAAPQWQATLGRELAGRRLGIAGFGRLGTAMAGFARAFGMEVTAWSRSLDAASAAAAGVAHAASLPELLDRSEILSLHLPLNAATRGLIGAAELARLPAGGVLINTARAPLVDQAALIAALESGHLSGAALDVFETEPLPADHPFRAMPQVLATPHLGYVTEETYRRFYPGAVEAITAWRAGTPIRILNAPDD